MKLTYWIMLLMFFVFLLQVLYPGLVDSYVFSSAALFERPWTIITSVFMHANPVHLLSNIFVFFFFGLAVEEEMSKGTMFFIFMLGAIVGNLASMAVYPPGTMFLGASAGIFALVGTGMLVRPLDWSVAPFLLPLPLVFIGILYAVLNIYSFVAGIDEGISYAGHMAGLAIGLLYGFRRTGFKKGVRTIALATVVLIVLIITIPLVLSYLGFV